jgi:hypothetical protein
MVPRYSCHLAALGRLEATTGLYYVRYLDDFPVAPISNNWNDTGIAGLASDKLFAVQTNEKVIQRCVLMTTDPGDLVLDPTCVRRGTLVLTPLDPPASGGKADLPASGGRGDLPAIRGRAYNPPPAEGSAAAPSPRAGRVGVGFCPARALRPSP